MSTMEPVSRPIYAEPNMARRQKMQERKEQFAAAYQQRQQEMMARRHGSDASDSTDVSEDDSLTHSEGSSAKTPSEYSLHTPEGFTPDEPQKLYTEVGIRSHSFSSEDEISGYMGDKHIQEITVRPRAIGHVKPKMLASITTTADFDFHRFSAVVDASRLQYSEEEDDVSSEDELLLSPIEVATPVAFSLPKTRPAVISIPSPTFPRRPASMEVTRMRHTQNARDKRISNPNPGSLGENGSQGFLAFEAKPFEVSDRPEGIFQAEIISVKAGVRRAQTNATPKKKPSSFFGKTKPSRMDSIKKLIRPAVQTPVSVPISRPLTQVYEESMPRGSIDDGRSMAESAMDIDVEPTMDIDMLDRLQDMSLPVSNEFDPASYITCIPHSSSGSESHMSSRSGSLSYGSPKHEGQAYPSRPTTSRSMRRPAPPSSVSTSPETEQQEFDVTSLTAPPPRNPRRGASSKYSPFPPQVNPHITARTSSLRSAGKIRG